MDSELKHSGPGESWVLPYPSGQNLLEEIEGCAGAREAKSHQGTSQSGSLPPCLVLSLPEQWRDFCRNS